MADVGDVITAQVDLLWSLSLALLLFEVYLIAAVFAGQLRALGWLADGLLILAAAAQLAAMGFGYFTYGSVVELVLAAPGSAEAQAYLRRAANDAALQFLSFALGLLAFLAVFALNPRTIGKVIQNAREN